MRSHSVKVMYSADELAELKRRSGLVPLATYIRMLSLGGSVVQPVLPDPADKFLVDDGVTQREWDELQSLLAKKKTTALSPSEFNRADAIIKKMEAYTPPKKEPGALLAFVQAREAKQAEAAKPLARLPYRHAERDSLLKKPVH